MSKYLSTEERIALGLQRLRNHAIELEEEMQTFINACYEDKTCMNRKGDIGNIRLDMHEIREDMADLAGRIPTLNI